MEVTARSFFFFRRLLKIAKNNYQLHACLSVRPSVHMAQLGSHWRDFYESWYLSIFLKTVEKIKVSLNSHKKNGYFTRKPINIFDRISLSSSWNKKCFGQFLEKIETHILCSVTVFFFLESHAICEIIWKNTVEWGRPQMTIWRMRMRIACWIPKVTNTHSGCVIFIAFPLQQWLHERASMLRYTYSVVFLFLRFKNIIRIIVWRMMR
jgi:hypothetical protein